VSRNKHILVIRCMDWSRLGCLGVCPRAEATESSACTTKVTVQLNLAQKHPKHKNMFLQEFRAKLQTTNHYTQHVQLGLLNCKYYNHTSTFHCQGAALQLLSVHLTVTAVANMYVKWACHLFAPQLCNPRMFGACVPARTEPKSQGQSLATSHVPILKRCIV
jgi:hypothetical protein